MSQGVARMRGVRFFLSVACGVCSVSALADIFHYNNVIIGDRAIGLGGAYAGISDDAAGVIYNPAGLAFASGGDVSGSANAYFQRTIVYKDIFPGFDFEEKSQSFFPSFFGGVQKLDSIWNGLVAGFAVSSPDSDFKNQNDQIKLPDRGVNFFHRTVNSRSNTLMMSAAAARRFGSRFSVGMSLSLVNIDELFQEYQHSILQMGIPVSDTAPGTELYKAQEQNLYRSLGVWAVQPVLGTQFVLSPKWVLGAAVRIPIIVKEELLNENDISVVYRFANGAVARASDIDSSAGSEYGQYGSGKVTTLYPGLPGGRWESNKPLKSLPMVARMGIAWFASPRFLWSLDVEHSTEAKDGDLTSYAREAVTNVMTGMEYYATPSLPVRLGAFTNFDSRRDLVAGQANEQVDHVDFYGGSLYVSWAQMTSQFGGGVIYQTGSGESQKIAGDTKFQKVEGSLVTFCFSASYQL